MPMTSKLGLLQIKVAAKGRQLAREPLHQAKRRKIALFSDS